MSYLFEVTRMLAVLKNVPPFRNWSWDSNGYLFTRLERNRYTRRSARLRLSTRLSYFTPLSVRYIFSQRDIDFRYMVFEIRDEREEKYFTLQSLQQGPDAHSASEVSLQVIGSQQGSSSWHSSIDPQSHCSPSSITLFPQDVLTTTCQWRSARG